MAKEKELNRVGRPLKYKTKEELEIKIQEYFDTECKDNVLRDEDTGEVLSDTKGRPIVMRNPPTVAGLALYLGFSDRASMYDYKERQEFSHTIKKAITKIEAYAEKQLTTGQSTGAIFWLKNHGWVDKTEKDLKVKEIPAVRIELVE